MCVDLASEDEREITPVQRLGPYLPWLDPRAQMRKSRRKRRENRERPPGEKKRKIEGEIPEEKRKRERKQVKEAKY